MSDLDSGLPPIAPLSTEPAVSLKGKGLPWPVYLALALAGVAVLAFLGLRSWKNREQRKVHVAFMEQFADYEKNEVNKFWRCLFGKDADPRRFADPEALSNQLEGALRLDPKQFPDKVATECVPLATSAAKRIKDFSPLPPAEYEAALDRYGKALAGLANAFSIWAEGAPKRAEAWLRENRIMAAGTAWSNTTDPRRPDPDALRYDRFLRCAVPDLERLKEGQALLEFLASKCVGKHTDQAYLDRLRDRCVPEGQEPPKKAPPTFARVLQKLVADYDREEQAWGACFRAMRKASKKEDLEGVGRAWVEALNASSEVRKIGKDLLKDD
ncbi:MAG: hypothetical protein RMK29_03635 [Myxococcales bacterium]|nr:hypothetical protein [Myxococcota bacterium]MDW8280778.1 hypothetical protein [Myxococcales bacterium]